MAPEEFNNLWDCWVTALSESYGKTRELVHNDKTRLAAKEFTKNFCSIMKQTYTITTQRCPAKYSDVSPWETWLRELYRLTQQTYTALRKDKTQEAQHLLQSIRQHFVYLHCLAGSYKTNDYLYAIHVQLQRESLDLQSIRILDAKLRESPPSIKVEEHRRAYRRLYAKWNKTFKNAGKDNTIDGTELKRLQRVFTPLYNEFGTSFE